MEIVSDMSHLSGKEKKGTDYKFDYIAQNIFLPIYAVIADDILMRTNKAEGKMIDIGCGGGHLGMALLEITQLIGWFIDIDEPALQIARVRAQERGLAGRAVFLKQDIHRMEFPDDFADLIISRGSYFLWNDLEKAFLEIYRVLAPGGKTYIGGGMGNLELAASIRQKMQAIMPGWPGQVHQRSARITDEWIRKILDRNDIAHEIINDESQGRWIIISK